MSEVTTTTTTTKPKYLTDYISLRIRLSDDERHALKTAYQERLRKDSQVSTARINPTSTISVETQGNDLHKELEMSPVVFADLINTRETLAAPIILRLQQVLGVEVLSRQRILEAANDYAEYLFSPNFNLKKLKQGRLGEGREGS
jgi:hypothetical protein